MDSWGSGEPFARLASGRSSQRCSNHKLANVIDQLPKKEWPEAKALLRKIPYAETESKECERLRDEFAARYRKAYPRAVETLCRDGERVPGRTFAPPTPLSRPFSAVRLRTDAAKRFKKVANAEALIWKILMIAEKKFRRLDFGGASGGVHRGQKFVDGNPLEETRRMRPAG